MNKGFWFLLTVFVVILDQVSKYWVSSTLIPYHPYTLFSTLNFTLAYNTGAAFSFLNGAGEWHRWFFASFSLIMSIVIMVWLWRTPKQDRLQAAGLSLILGGALGNLIDRALQGVVVDFIDFHYGSHHFATFNVADSAICIGAALLFLDFLFSKPVK